MPDEILENICIVQSNRTVSLSVFQFYVRSADLCFCFAAALWSAVVLHNVLKFFLFTCVHISIMAHYNFKKITVVPSAKVRIEQELY